MKDFLPIEEKVAWNLSAGMYDPAVAGQMRQLISRMNQMSESLSMYNMMVHRAMDERKLVLSQTQMLHAQIIRLKEENYQLRSQMGGIGIQALQAADMTATPDPVPEPDSDRGQTGQADQSKLYVKIHFGDDACPPDHIRYSELRRGVKRDKCGNESQSVSCPNCDAVFVDRNGGKDCALRDHLIKFKCPKLKHLRPADQQTAPGPKKKKKQQDEEVGQGSISDELDDLEVQVSSGPEISPTSMSNIMHILQIDRPN